LRAAVYPSLPFNSNLLRPGTTAVSPILLQDVGNFWQADKTAVYRPDHFCRSTGIGRRLVERLILAGAMDEWDVPRRQLVWQLGTLSYKEEGLALPDDPPVLTLPPLSQAEQLLAEQSVMGISTGPHVLSFYRTWLDANGILDSRELAETPHGRRVRVAGLLVVHQSPPTAKGFHFLTLETETGLVNVIVRPAIYRQYSPLLRTAQLLLVAGVVQQEEGVTNVLAGRISCLDA
jgi:error-prone DNA polymerase